MKLSLETWRAERGKMSQEKLSELTGISPTTLSKWENGKSSPTMKNLKKVADALGISIDDIRLP